MKNGSEIEIDIDIYDYIDFQDSDFYPNLLCVITGKGPLKEYYNACIAEHNWNHVTFLMPWLEPGNGKNLIIICPLSEL